MRRFLVLILLGSVFALMVHASSAQSYLDSWSDNLHQQQRQHHSATSVTSGEHRK